jgi:hypothetical protein
LTTIRSCILLPYFFLVGAFFFAFGLGAGLLEDTTEDIRLTIALAFAFTAHLAIWGFLFFSYDREDNPLVVKDYFELFHEVFIYILPLVSFKIIKR